MINESIKLYYSKKMGNFVFNYNKNELHYQKTYKKYTTFKQFFDSSNNLWVIAVLNVKIGPKCRNKDWVLGQNSV
jgi:hypothetical protein